MSMNIRPNSCARCGIDHSIAQREFFVLRSPWRPELKELGNAFEGPQLPVRVSMQGNPECACNCNFEETRTHTPWCNETQCAVRAMRDPTSSYWITVDRQ